MAKTLAIKVKYSSEGEGKVIKNINELEGAIEDLSNELKTLDFGSEEYKRTAAELNKLKSEFKDVEKEFEGLDTEQKLSAIGGALELVSGSFLIAASAARTFGADAETVEEVERLEQQALEAVNIALGVRAVAEGLVQANMLKRVVTEKAANIQTRIATGLQAAYAAIVGTSTGALKAFRIALISTGIGAAVVAIGALIANWDKLTAAIFKSNEEADRFGEINKEAQKSIAKTSVELDFYAGIVSDVTKSEGERLEALEELNRLGVITEDITLDQADALDILNERLELARDNILLKAQAEAASALLTDALKEQIEAQSSSLEDNLSWWEEGLFAISKYTTVYGFFTADAARATKAAENQAEAVGEVTKEVEKYEKIYLEILDGLNENEAKLRKEREKSDKNVKSRNKEKENRNKLDAEYDKLLEQLTKTIEKTARATKTLATETRGEVEIVGKANKLIEDQNALLEERLDIIGTSIGETKEQLDLTRQLAIAIGGIKLPEDENVTAYQDAFAKILYSIDSINEYASSDEASTDGVVSTLLFGDGGDSDFEINRLNRLRDTLDSISMDELDEDQRRILLDFFQKTVDIDNKWKDYDKTLKKTLETQDKLRENLKQQLDLGDIDQKTYEEKLKNLNEIVSKAEELNGINVDYGKLLTDIVALQDSAIENEVTTKELNNAILDTISMRVFEGQRFNELTDVQKGLIEDINADLVDQTKIYQETQDVAVKLGDALTKIQANIAKQGEQISDSQFKQLQQFIISNEEQIDSVKEYFSTISAESTNLTEEQIENLKKLIDSIEFQQQIEVVQDFANKVIEEFTNISNGIQSVLAASISLQLQELDYYEELAMSSIGDETERAKQIQEELRQDIAKQRFELEKKARLTELRFSLASSIANTAQAVLKALATVPPPAGQILAAIYGGIGAAQGVVIQDQINFVKGQQFVPARRGGLVMGASHEEGGVMMNGGLVLEGGEAIINKNAAAQFSDLLSQINVSTGGRALSVDDSALVQEIRKQNQRPIKTYVLYNDIQDTNKINSRLEQISRL